MDEHREARVRALIAEWAASHDELAAAIDTFVLAYDEHDGQALPLGLRRQPTPSRMNPRRINAALH